MSDDFEIKENKMNKRTAMVYAGAAFLIVVVGVRTLAQTMDDGLNWIGYITILALAVEFSLLLLYAVTIYNQPQEEQQMMLSPQVSIENSLNKDVVNITKSTQQLSNDLIKQNLENIKTIQKMNQQYSTQLASYLRQMKQVISDMEKSVNSN